MFIASIVAALPFMLGFLVLDHVPAVVRPGDHAQLLLAAGADLRRGLPAVAAGPGAGGIPGGLHNKPEKNRKSLEIGRASCRERV